MTNAEHADEHAGIAFQWRGDVDDTAVDELHAAAFEGEPGSYRWSRCRPASLGWVTAISGGRLVGFVNMVSDGDRHGFLLDTAVAPDHQRQGIGRQLVRLAVDEAHRAGCAYVHVDFEPHLSDFYASCGFTATAAGLHAPG